MKNYCLPQMEIISLKPSEDILTDTGTLEDKLDLTGNLDIKDTANW